MKSKSLKPRWIFCTVTVLCIFLSPICGANTGEKPVVIRKKIAATAVKTPEDRNHSNPASNQKFEMPEPESGISILRNDSATRSCFSGRIFPLRTA